MTSHPELELYDVVVIGAGPVGKMAALLLGRAGHSVLSVERKADDYPLPRAVGHDAEIARLWQSAGLPPDRMSDAVEAYDDLYVWTNGVGDVLQEIDLRGIGTSAWNNAYFYHQPGLESHLARAVGEQSTVETRRGVEAHIVDQDADAVTVSLSSAGGSAATTVRARYVIGADGAKSSTRTSVDIDWNDLGFFFDWLVVDVLPGEGFEVTNVAKQICDPERPTAQVPSGPGRRRWEFMLLESEDPRELEQPERIWELLSHVGVTPDKAEIERGVVYTFGAGWAQTWRRDRVFLVGDAAHLMPPFAGQGMSSGLRDVLNLAWKLDLVLRDKAPAELLASYEAERVAHVNDNIQFSMFLAKVICITNPQIAAGRDGQMIAAIRDRAAPPPPAPRLGQGVHTGEHGGELSRQGFVTAAGVATPARFDDVFGPGALIARGDVSLPDALTAALSELGVTVASFGGKSATFSDASETYGAWFDEWGVDAVLIRPDFFVYGTATMSDVGSLAEQYIAAVVAAHR